MKYNPVQQGNNTIGATGSTLAEKRVEYFEKMQEFVPLIEELDDEIVTADFFSRKKNELRGLEEPEGDDRGFLNLPLIEMIKSIGFTDAALTTISTYEPY